MAFSAVEVEALRHNRANFTERFTSGANTAVSQTTGLGTPKELDSVLVTFHDGQDPPVQQAVAAKTIVATFVSATDDGYDHILITFEFSGKTFKFYPDNRVSFKAADQLLVAVDAAGANVHIDVAVLWRSGE